MNMKKIYLFLSILSILFITGCDDKLPDEQFEKYAVITRNGFHEWNIPYSNQAEFLTTISVSVSGTSILSKDIEVEVAVKPENLEAYNFEKFRNETSSYYSLLPEAAYEFETTKVKIKAGDEYTLIPIKIKLNNMNKYLNYVLPVEIVSVSDYSIGINGRNQSLINFVLVNEYSGTYSMAVNQRSSEGDLTIDREQRLGTINHNTCFFPVAYLNKTNAQKDYMVNMTINPDSTLNLAANNPDIEFTFATPNKERNQETNIIEMKDSGKKTKSMKFYMEYSYLDKSNPEVEPVRRNIKGYFLREVQIGK